VGNKRMTTLTFLVDDAGDLWSADSPDFHHRLGVRNPDFDIAAFAVKNFGWIEIGYGARRMTVRLRPSAVEPKALMFLKDVIRGTDKSEIVLHVWLQAWKKQKFSNRGAALAQIDELLASSGERRSPRFTSVPKSDSVLFADRNLDVIRTLSWFRERLGSLDRNAVLQRCRQSPTGLMGFVEKNSANPEFRFGQIGENVSFYNTATREQALGRGPEAAPDPDFASWCIPFWDAVTKFGGQPVVEDVEAMIKGTDGVRMLRRFRRVGIGVETTDRWTLAVVSVIRLTQPVRREAA